MTKNFKDYKSDTSRSDKHCICSLSRDFPPYRFDHTVYCNLVLLGERTVEYIWWNVLSDKSDIMNAIRKVISCWETLYLVRYCKLIIVIIIVIIISVTYNCLLVMTWCLTFLSLHAIIWAYFCSKFRIA